MDKPASKVRLLQRGRCLTVTKIKRDTPDVIIYVN